MYNKHHIFVSLDVVLLFSSTISTAFIVEIVVIFTLTTNSKGTNIPVKDRGKHLPMNEDQYLSLMIFVPVNTLQLISHSYESLSCLMHCVYFKIIRWDSPITTMSHLYRAAKLWGSKWVRFQNLTLKCVNFVKLRCKCVNYSPINNNYVT